LFEFKEENRGCCIWPGVVRHFDIAVLGKGNKILLLQTVKILRHFDAPCVKMTYACQIPRQG